MQSKGLYLIALHVLMAWFAMSGSTRHAEAQAVKVKQSESMEARLRMLEDREEIRRLMIQYGSTLDQRDFTGFSKLFARDAEYGGGGGGGVTKGPEAIARLLEDVFRKNPTNVNTPNFHLFCNEVIQTNGDQATAVSKGIFVVRGNDDTPDAVMLATYRDLLIREDGVWKFKQRLVHGDIPSAGK